MRGQRDLDDGRVQSIQILLTKAHAVSLVIQLVGHDDIATGNQIVVSATLFPYAAMLDA